MQNNLVLSKRLCVLMLMCMWLLALPLSTDAASVEKSFDSRIYEGGRLDRYSTMRVYNVKGEDYVPYVSVEEYLNYLYKGDIVFHLKDGESVLIATRNNVQTEFDAKNSIIRSDDWDAFFGSYGERALPNGILGPAEFNAQAVSTKNSSTKTKATDFSIDLKHYGMQILMQDGKALIPFAVLQNIFAMPRDENKLSFNGDHFFDIRSPMQFIYGHNINQHIRLNSYANAYYSGSFCKEKEIPPSYAKYAYGTTCLLFDLYYGHKKEKGIKTFDSYLAENGLKEGLLSTDADKNSEAFLDLIYKLFDSGHDSVELSHSIFNTSTYINTIKVVTAYGGIKPTLKSLQKLSYKMTDDMGVNFLAGDTGTYEQYQKACQELKLDPILLTYIYRDDSGKPYKIWLEQAKDYAKMRGTPEENFEPIRFPGKERSEGNNKLNESFSRMRALKPKDFGSSRVDIVDDTAFIYFEGFNESEKENVFYSCPPNASMYDESTFGQFYDAFAQIQQNPKVKKVVIDLSYNGGGAVGALTAILGFMSPDGEANITYYNTLNQNYCSEWYHVDTNLDGKFDDEDGFGGQYDFYVLTSGCSYSCGNALPFFSQVDGLAKIIGESPGGGDCAVYQFLDAYGHIADMSGCWKLGRMYDGKFISDEYAVKVDYSFGDDADKLYFNYKAIAEWIKKKTGSN